MLAKLHKLLESLSHRALGSKVKSYTVRKLSTTSKQTMRTAFQQTRHLRRFAAGGMLIGMGAIYLVSILHDRLKAVTERPFNFVNANFDYAARAWKRRRERERKVLKERFWPIYQLDIECRNPAPPYHDEASFLERAEAALDDDLSILEGINHLGQPSRIPFRHAQRFFSCPPFSLHKNSVNDLRFSWYREVRDAHLGGRRLLFDLTQSTQFENYLLVGFRREILKLIARGLSRAQTMVRLEDILGASHDEFMDKATREERDRIRAYVARKLTVKRRPTLDRVFVALEDGFLNTLKEILRADPIYLTSQRFVVTEAGALELHAVPVSLESDIQEMIARFGPERRGHQVDFAALETAKEAATELNQQLLDFFRKENQAHHGIVRGSGAMRAIRMAVQMDTKLWQALLRQTPKDRERLLESFRKIAEAQSDYDRALLELRGVFQGCLADFEFYNRFLKENFFNWAYEYPDADYDPKWVKYVPRFLLPIRRGWRWLRQKLQLR